MTPKFLLSDSLNRRAFAGENALRDHNFLWGLTSWVRFESGVYKWSYYSADARHWTREVLGKRVWRYKSRRDDELIYCYTLGEVNHTWAQSTRHGAAIHYPRWLLLLWRRGEIIGWEHTYWCGNSSTWAITTDDRSMLKCEVGIHTCRGCREALAEYERTTA